MMVLPTLAVLAAVVPGPAAPPAGDRYARFFDRVQPLLAAQCVSCHGPDKAKGGLRLDTPAEARKGGDSGPAFIPGRPDQSLLIQAVRGTRPDHPDWRMPPKQPLPADRAADLEAWVKDGAVWPEPVRVLFEDDPGIVALLPPGEPGGEARLDERDRAAGRAALAVRGQRQAVRIPGWEYRVREHPGPGEYRYIRFAWKKTGGGAAYVELANAGRWRKDPKQRNAAWVAGPNGSGWDAHILSEAAPAGWAVVTRDLWADRGDWNDFAVTGLSVTAVGGGEVLLDSVVLGRTREDLDAYAPGRGLSAATGPAVARRVGDAWTDPNNPIVKIFHGTRLDLWSLRKPVRPGEPAVRRTGWARTPVDRFILAGLEAKDLSPSPEADRRTLIRRLTFDLTGLPPTPHEVDAFLADASPDAYEKLVERLLASPHYGERWGGLWLDVVRYADTNGYERDEFRPDMWRYRDYVIRSFNADKPFDRFVAEQLAGDELADGPVRDAADADRWVATGFLRLGQYDSTASIFEEDGRGRDDLMADLVNTTGSAFLGLTLACCQCHDHKYDPLSQADHYRLRAFFAAVKPRDDLVIDPADAADRIRRLNDALDSRIKELTASQADLLAPARDKLAAERRAKFPDDIRKLLAGDGKTHDAVTRKKLEPYRKQLKVSDADARAALAKADQQQLDALGREIAELRKEKREFHHAAVMTDVGRSAPPTRVLFQGDYTQPRDEVPPGFPSALDPNPASPAPVPTASTGRRLALARWIASADNPWTARVIANRLWQHHFGRGLVATPNDFGFSGTRPSHPELLDWLATELTTHGWSLKHLHRVMVLSSTYRQSSARPDGHTTEAVSRLLGVPIPHSAFRIPHSADPDNRLLWRQNPRRLDAETLRDAVLAVSGKLRPDAGGPPRWPGVPEELLKAQPGILEAIKGEDGGRRQGWYASPPDEVDVRSVYLIHKRALPVPFLQPFDLPDSSVSCGCRQVTTVAPQALTLLNSPEATRLARAFADAVATAAADPDRRVDAAFRAALLRSPDAGERAAAVDLLRRHADRYRAGGAEAAAADRRALVDLCRALLNANEFLYID